MFACCGFGGRYDHLANAAFDMIGMSVHRPDPRPLRLWIKRAHVTVRAVIAAVERGPVRPTATANQGRSVADSEIGAVCDQLRVQPHARIGCFNLLGRQIALLQFRYRALHQCANVIAVGREGQLERKWIHCHRLHLSGVRRFAKKRLPIVDRCEWFGSHDEPSDYSVN